MSGLNIWWVGGIAVALAIDALAVAVAVGLTLPRVTGRHVFRLAWHFGLFQFLMPIAGWLAGHKLTESIEAYGRWVAAALLVGIGGKMLYEAISRTGTPRLRSNDPTKGLSLIALSIATSLDALAAGLSMALLGVSVWVPAIVIGLVAGALTVVGMRFGGRLGTRWERGAEIAGGLILLAIAARIGLAHLV